MHYKRTAALLKIVHRTKGKIEKVLQEIVEDVVRHPDKYSTQEKIMLWQYLNRKYQSSLCDIASAVGSNKGLSKKHQPITKGP